MVRKDQFCDKRTLHTKPMAAAYTSALICLMKGTKLFQFSTLKIFSFILKNVKDLTVSPFGCTQFARICLSPICRIIHI